MEAKQRRFSILDIDPEREALRRMATEDADDAFTSEVIDHSERLSSAQLRHADIMANPGSTELQRRVAETRIRNGQALIRATTTIHDLTVARIESDRRMEVIDGRLAQSGQISIRRIGVVESIAARLGI